jgi:uncharacterized membrane protein HdeD (DUF308 family)
MSEGDFGEWIRVQEVIFGLILISLSGAVFLLSEAWLPLMVILLGVALFLFGISSIVKGYHETFQSRRQRIANVIVGLIFNVTSILAIIYWPIGGLLWAIILTISLLILGITLFITGILGAVYAIWHRVFVVIIGAIIIALGIFIVTQPMAAQFLLALILATGLLLAGIYLLVLGITGRRAMLE